MWALSLIVAGATMRLNRKRWTNCGIQDDGLWLEYIFSKYTKNVAIKTQHFGVRLRLKVPRVSVHPFYYVAGDRFEAT